MLLSCRVCFIVCPRNILKPLATATDLPRYALLARCAEIFLSRLDVDDNDTEEVTNACLQLLKKQSPVAYLKQLEEAATMSRSANKSDTTALDLLTNDNGATKRLANSTNNDEKQDLKRDALQSLAYPVLVHMDVFLASDRVEQAIDIAVKMESCVLLSEHDQSQAWTKIFHFLIQKGQIFLDGFSLHEEDYQAKRKIILLKIVNRVRQIGMDVFLDGYMTILQQVALIRDMTDDERICIQRACHQTVLRILQTKYNEQRGTQEFREVYWKTLEEIPGASGFRWSSLSLSSSSEEQIQWANQLLCESNDVPVSLRFDGNFSGIDIDSLVHRKTNANPLLALEPQGTTAQAAPVPTMETAEGANATTVADEEEAQIEIVDSDEDDVAEPVIDTDSAVLDDDDIAEGVIDDPAHDSAAGDDDDDDEDDDVIEVIDSDSDEEAAEAVQREVDDSDETADEGSVNDLFERQHDGEEEVEVDSRSGSDEENGELDQQPHADANEDGQGKLSDTVDLAGDSSDDGDGDGDDNMHNNQAVTFRAEEEASHSSAEVVVAAAVAPNDHAMEADLAANQSMDEVGSQAGTQAGYGSQTGYEPEDTHGFTEEEVSEAIHTEDEDEERQQSQRLKKLVDKSSNMDAPAPVAVPAKPVASTDEPQTLSDMDYADEHTTGHEDDPGAESSELDEGGGTNAPQTYAHEGSREGVSLMDFALRAQAPPHHEESDHTPTEDSTDETPPAERQEKFDSPANSTAGDTGAAHVGASSVTFLEEGSLAASLEENDGQALESTEVVVDHIQEKLESEAKLGEDSAVAAQTPASRQLSVADTSGAHIGSVSFLNSVGYAPTDDEVEEESPKKVLVDCVPESFDQSPVKHAPMDVDEDDDKQFEDPPGESPRRASKGVKEQRVSLEGSPSKEDAGSMEAPAVDGIPQIQQNDAMSAEAPALEGAVQARQELPVDTTVVPPAAAAAGEELASTQLASLSEPQAAEEDLALSPEKAASVLKEMEVESTVEMEENEGIAEEIVEADQDEVAIDLGGENIEEEEADDEKQEPEKSVEMPPPDDSVIGIETAESGNGEEAAVETIEEVVLESKSGGEETAPNENDDTEKVEDGPKEEENTAGLDEGPPVPATPPRRTRAGTASNTHESNSTFGVSSVNIPHNHKDTMTSPGMSSVATDQEEEEKVPASRPTRAANLRLPYSVGDGPSTARKSNRRNAPTEEITEQEATTNDNEGVEKASAKDNDEPTKQTEDPGDETEEEEKEDDTAASKSSRTPTRRRGRVPAAASTTSRRATRGRNPKEPVSDVESTKEESHKEVAADKRAARARGKAAALATAEASKEEEQETTKAPARRPTRAAKKAATKQDDKEDASISTRRSTRGRPKKVEKEDDSISTRRSTRGRPKKVEEEPESDVGEDEDDAGDSTIASRTSRRSTANAKKKAPGTKPARRSGRNTKHEEEENDDDDGGSVVSQSSRRSKRAASKKETSEAEEESDDESKTASKPKRATRPRKTAVSVAEESKGSRRATKRTKESDGDNNDEDEEASEKTASTRASHGSARRSTRGNSTADDVPKQKPGEPNTAYYKRLQEAASSPPPKPTGRATRSRKRGDSLSEAEETDNASVAEAAAAPPKAARKKRKTAAVKEAEPALPPIPEDNALATPDAKEPKVVKKATRTTKMGNKAKAADAEESEEEAEKPKVATRATRSKRGAEGDDESAASKSTTRTTRKRAKTTEGDEVSHVDSQAPVRKTRARKAAKADKSVAADDASVAAESAASSVRRSSRRNKGTRGT